MPKTLVEVVHSRTCCGGTRISDKMSGSNGTRGYVVARTVEVIRPGVVMGPRVVTESVSVMGPWAAAEIR